MPEIDEFGDYEIRVHPYRRSLWISRSAPAELLAIADEVIK
jgi:hypothetical protein